MVKVSGLLRSRRFRMFALAGAMMTVPAAYVLLDLASPKHGEQAVQASQTSPELPRLEELARLHPTSANRLNLSRALIEQKQPDRATAVLEPLVAEEPSNGSAWNNLCVARILKQEYAAALANCDKAVAINSASQLFQNNRKWAQGELNKVLQTLQAQEKVPTGERNAAYFLSQGLNFYHAGKYPEALLAWQKSHQLNPKDAQTENNVGVAEMMLTQYPAAAEAFRQALVLDPTSELAKNNLAWASSKMQGSH